MGNPFGKPTGAPAPSGDDFFEIDVPEDDGSGFVIDLEEAIVRVVGLEKATSEASNPMWVWYFAIHEGEHAGFELRIYTALTAAAMWKLRETLAALGLGEGGSKSKFTKKEAIGRLAVATLGVDTYKGTKRTVIESLAPHPDGAGKRAATPGAAKPAAPPAGKPAAAGKPASAAPQGKPAKPGTPPPAKKAATPPPADPPAPDDSEEEPEEEVPPSDDGEE